MRYYKYLYLSEGLERKKDRVIRRLETGKLQPSIYLVLISDHSRNQMEIVRAVCLLQPNYPRDQLLVAGIAESHGEALELVEKMVRETYDSTGEADVRNYILMKEQEG